MKKMINLVSLFDSRENCCGCGSCMNICPKNAIFMKEDKLGFRYPVIEPEKCIGCKKCVTACAYQVHNPEENHQLIAAYGVMSKNNELTRLSASSGVFAELAKLVLDNKGIVYGCSMEFCNGTPVVKHIEVSSIKMLPKLQGSKYVSSDTGLIYRSVKENLKSGKTVLFSGTPCQVDALKSFLKNERTDNLITVDIICHGVPSNKMFSDYINLLSNKLGGQITDFRFRDKSVDWGVKGSVYFVNRRGVKKKKPIIAQLSSYYKLFLDGVICRDSCYKCKYANKNRTGDLTLGDYWGFDKVHPEQLTDNDGNFSIEKNISCVLVNTPKGKDCFSMIKNNFFLCNTTFENIAEFNHQLMFPLEGGKLRKHLLKIYSIQGYAEVDKYYEKKIGLKKYVFEFWNAIPLSFRKRLKQIKK
ncbi:MAG: Coenzyme F420 hydrogenase/dehydrogenase, beta subunit C-terminal domain [Ruminococcus sp.]|nr:Coenzyme F420 hydrogenase/dehydrogenase, beta subunit C-terminal domain [Ruminococcus sp.]